MRKIVAYLFIVIVFSKLLYGQKVALVLSGGGAKGFAHLGVIKALEEHDIPIDYIVGSSMGAVIGAFYSIGMSVAQIESFVLSEGFQKSINGEIRREYNYYFNKESDNSTWVNVDFSIDSMFQTKISSNLANDLSINFKLAEQFARESLIAGYNFDSLFIPFRAVASEIFTQKTVVLKSGSLAKAVRASLSVPLFYNPIKIDDQYLFDGGIYNNFPIDIAKKEFSPDITIGINVASKTFQEYPYKQDDKIINQALMYMMFDNADSSSLSKKDVYIEPNMSSFSSLDFSKAKSIIDSGYNATIRNIDKIKIERKSNKEKISEARKKFLQKRKPLVFRKIELHGFNSNQSTYIKKLFSNKSGTHTLEQIKKNYYTLVSEHYFNTIYPDILFDTVSNDFSFHLYSRPRNNFYAGLGGVISTKNVNYINLNLKYYNFNKYFSKTNFNFYTGRFYTSVSLTSKFIFLRKTRLYFEPDFRYNRWKYTDKQLIIRNSETTSIDILDRFFGFNIGLPVGGTYKLIGTFGGVSNKNEFNSDIFLNSEDLLDQQKIKGYKFQLNISRNTLNDPQYPTKGGSFDTKMTAYNVSEEYIHRKASIFASDFSKPHKWLKVKLKLEQYFSFGKKYSHGYLLESAISTQEDFTTLTGTIINASTFNPLPYSQSLIVQQLRSYNYIAVGSKSIFSLLPKMDFRLEGYLFKPIYDILGKEQTVLRVNQDEFFLSGVASLVYHTPIGPIAANLNYYELEKFGLFVHFGYVLFDKSSLE